MRDLLGGDVLSEDDDWFMDTVERGLHGCQFIINAMADRLELRYATYFFVSRVCNVSVTAQGIADANTGEFILIVIFGSRQRRHYRLNHRVHFSGVSAPFSSIERGLGPLRVFTYECFPPTHRSVPVRREAPLRSDGKV